MENMEYGTLVEHMVFLHSEGKISGKYCPRLQYNQQKRNRINEFDYLIKSVGLVQTRKQMAGAETFPVLQLQVLACRKYKPRWRTCGANQEVNSNMLSCNGK